MRAMYIFGDSLLRGVMPDENGMYHSTNYIDFDGLARKYGISISNYSMPTFTSVQGLDWIRKHIQSVPVPDIAIVEYGGNDCDYRWRELAASDRIISEPHRTSPDEFADTYESILDELLAWGAMPVVTLCPPFPVHIYIRHLISSGISEEKIQAYITSYDNFASEYMTYKDTMRELASKKQLSVLNIEKTFAFLDNLVDYYSEDGLHPNKDGYWLIHNAFDEFISGIKW